MPRLSYLACCLGAVLALGLEPALAERADRSKPMNIEADNLRHDDSRQISIFSGRVVLTKGSIVIRGEQIEVRQDAQGNQYGRVTSAPGQLAFFRQKREGLDEYMEGEAEVIDYDSRADVVKLQGQARLRRLRGATLADEVSGSLIQYNGSTEVFAVDGGASGTDSGRGRVRAMLTPKPEPEPASPAPNLRTTTTLGGERR